ncbi:hypothetical protein ACQ5SO_08080 [Rhodovulum sp. DZ06]|uniref:hypothetical protein n=1 Tax=Rhodovulum sp. DZ06 TaxID=3425126 RepID=UPI003D3506DA
MNLFSDKAADAPGRAAKDAPAPGDATPGDARPGTGETAGSAPAGSAPAGTEAPASLPILDYAAYYEAAETPLPPPAPEPQPGAASTRRTRRAAGDAETGDADARPGGTAGAGAGAGGAEADAGAGRRPGPPPRIAAGTGWALLLALSAVAAALAAALLGTTQIFMSEMIHDVLHLIDGARRIAVGQVPHVDFHTPLGRLSFQPVTWAAELFGLNWDRAILAANGLVAAALLPLLVWAGRSRLGFWPGLGLGIFCLYLCFALTWRFDYEASTLAMSYNRWGWALALPLSVLMIVPPRMQSRRAADWVDAVLIGLGAAALVWLKITYAAGVALLWLAWAAAGGRRMVALRSVLVGIPAIVIPAIIVAGGPGAAIGMAEGYFGDLMDVRNSNIRASAGAPPLAILAAPVHAPLAIIWVVAGLLLLKAGLRRSALMWFAAMAGTTLIAWQNYGNNQVGLVGLAACLPVFAVVIGAVRPDVKLAGIPADTALRAMTVAVALVAAQQVLLLNRSIFVGYREADGLREHPFVALGAPDLAIKTSLSGVVAEQSIVPPRTAPENLAPDQRRRELFGTLGARTLGGREFPDCTVRRGIPQVQEALQEAIAARPALQGRTILVADIVNHMWMSVGAPPQEGVQIWQYSPHGDTIAEAELFAVPTCAIDTSNRNQAIDEALARGDRLTSVLSLPLWEVFETAPALPAPGN